MNNIGNILCANILAKLFNPAGRSPPKNLQPLWSDLATWRNKKAESCLHRLAFHVLLILNRQGYSRVAGVNIWMTNMETIFFFFSPKAFYDWKSSLMQGDNYLAFNWLLSKPWKRVLLNLEKIYFYKRRKMFLNSFSVIKQIDVTSHTSYKNSLTGIRDKFIY